MIFSPDGDWSVPLVDKRRGACKSDKMKFLKASLEFLFKWTLLGFVVRTVVAIFIEPSSLLSLKGLQANFQSLVYGWHFDLAIAAFFYCLLFGSLTLINYRQSIFKVLNGLALFAYFLFAAADALYLEESGRHISYEVYTLHTLNSSLSSVIAKYWLPMLVVVMASLFGFRFLKASYAPTKNLFLRGPVFLFIAAISVLFMRGFDGIPQDPAWAFKAGGGYKGANIALNGVYGITWYAISGKKSSKQEVSTPIDFKSQEIFKAWKDKRGIQQPFKNFDGNIVIVFLEGWSGVLTDMKDQGVPLVPFFTEFRKQALHVDLMVAGGHRTTEGVFATMCSMINPLGKSIMYSEVETKPFVCLPHLLAQKGYSSAFFQGSDQNTSGVGPLAQKTGFTDSYGKREMPGWTEKKLNAWGVFDTDLYQFTQEKMDEMTEPMLIGINTNSTHDTVLPKGVETDLKDLKMFKQFRYADGELKEFYEQLKKRPWKKDWVLVLVADHTTYATSFFENYYIPFAMKYHSVEKNGPKQFEDKYLPGVFHQHDVAATLADLTGVEAPHFLGRSLLRPQDFSSGAAIFHLGELAWFEGDWAVVSNIRKFGDKKCFQWRTDPSFVKALDCPKEATTWYDESVSFIKETQEILFKN